MNAKVTYCNPGQIILTHQKSILSTVLGSCVSVCLYDLSGQIAAMNHFQFPINQLNSKEIGRYGDSSIQHMIRLTRSRIGHLPLVAKIFGGSSIQQSHLEMWKTGEKNSAIAKAILQNNGIEIISEDVGGNKGRKIDFETDSGKVKVKYLPNNTL